MTPKSTQPLIGRAYSEAFFQQHPGAQTVIELFEYLPAVFFYAKDAQHRYIGINHRTLRDIFGLEEEELLYGRTDLDFQPPALAEAYHAEDRRVMELGKAIPNQVWLVPHVRGTPGWYVSTKIPLLSPNQNVIGIAGVMYPIDTPEEQSSFFQELTPVLKYIDDNYTQPISMKEMAELADLSSTQFNYKFRSILRMSPTEYILSRRIQDAQSKLIQSSRSIADIGMSVGFFDQSHFTKRFSKITGMTPLAYRNRFRHP